MELIIIIATITIISALGIRSVYKTLTDKNQCGGCCGGKCTADFTHSGENQKKAGDKC